MRRGEEAYLGEDLILMVNGLTMTYVDNFAVRVEFTMHDIALPQQDFVQTRKGQGRITGTMSGFTWSDYLLRIALSRTTQVSVVGIIKNADTKKSLKVEVQGVQFSSADLMNAQTGQPVKFELPFTASNIKVID